MKKKSSTIIATGDTINGKSVIIAESADKAKPKKQFLKSLTKEQEQMIPAWIEKYSKPVFSGQYNKDFKFEGAEAMKQVPALLLTEFGAERESAAERLLGAKGAIGADLGSDGSGGGGKDDARHRFGELPRFKVIGALYRRAIASARTPTEIA